MAVFLRGLTTRTYSLMCKHTQKLRKHNCKYLCRAIHMSVIRNKYEEVFRESIQKPEEFWGKAAENLIWHKRWEKVLDNSDPPFTKWSVFSFCKQPCCFPLHLSSLSGSSQYSLFCPFSFNKTHFFYAPWPK